MLIANKVPIEVLEKYGEYVDVFSQEVVTELLKYTGINNHLINLEKGKQPSYGPIYSVESVKLKTLKTYIKDNLKNSFIKPLRTFAGILILFVKKANSFL